MKCEEFILSVEEYLDGELDQVVASRVVAHMAACEPCAEYYETLESEQALFAGYSRDVEVTPALWTAVEAEMQKDRARNRSLFERLRSGLTHAAGLVGLTGVTAPRFALASALALAVVAAGVSIAVLRSAPPAGPGLVAGIPNPDPPTNPPPISETGGIEGTEVGKPSVTQPEITQPPAPVRTPVRVVADRTPRHEPKRATRPKPVEPSPIAKAENTYMTAIDVLTRDYQRRRTEFDPQSVQEFDKTIAVLDQTIATTRKAARENPRDTEAMHHMLTAYSAKVDAMRNLVD